MFRLAAFGGAAFTAATLAGSVWIPRPAADVAVRDAATLACAVGIGLAAWTGWRSRGDARRWRLLLAGALACSQLPLVGSTMAAVEGREFAGVSRHDALYLLGYGLALAAILTFPGAPRGDSGDPGGVTARRRYAVVVLDSLLVVGSLVLMGEIGVLRNSVTDPIQLVAVAADNAAETAVVAAAFLLPSFRLLQSPVSFILLAGGVAAHTLSANAVLPAVAHGRPVVPPPMAVGLVAGPVLMALACLAPPPARDSPPGRVKRQELWVRVVLSYSPVGTVAVMALVLLPTGWEFEDTELYGLVALLLLALARQMILLADNNRLLDLIRHQALHDPLTGLANRTLFLDRLGLAVARHASGGQMLALLFCDLDDFKDVNDTLGHAAGDELLRATASRLAGAVRPADTVARLGGDEFVVLFDGLQDDPETIARRVVDTVRGPPAPAGSRPCMVHVSAGLVVAGRGAGPVTPDALLDSADLAMYAAKHRAKGDLVVYRSEIHGPAPVSREYVEPGVELSIPRDHEKRRGS